MDTTYPIHEHEFQAWFAKHLPDDVLGVICDPEQCMFARFLEATYGRPFTVLTTLYGPCGEPYGSYSKTPNWVKEDIVFFDTCFIGVAIAITKVQYEQAKEQQRRDREEV